MNGYDKRNGVDVTTSGSTAPAEVTVVTGQGPAVARDRESDSEDRLERALRTLFEHLASLGPACT